MQNRFNTYSDILLLHPPGWSLNYGSPHLGLPLLQGYLKQRNIPCKIRDLNIESAMYYDLKISSKQINSFINNGFDEEKADALYFSIVDKLKDIGNHFNGNWKVKSGFNFFNCNLSNSEDIRKFSKSKSPFTEFYLKELIPSIIKDSPFMIGFSVSVPSQLLSTFEIIRLIKNAGYKGKIIIGGNTTTRILNEIQKEWVFNLVDFIIGNQGEESLELLWNSLSQGQTEFYNIPNLIWQNPEGEFVRNKYKKLAKNNFSMPDFTGYPIGNYWGINYLPIIGARGCYYGKCSFCPIPFAWGNNGFVGFDKVENITTFLESAIEQYNNRNFSFVEEAMNPKILYNLSKSIISQKIDITFEGYVRLDKTWKDPKYLSAFQKAGLKKVFVGMELITSDSREVMNKSDDIGSILEYLQLFKKYGIKVHLFTMFGFPGTTVNDAISTIEYVLKNSAYIETIDVSNFVYAKHTIVNGITPIIEKENDWALDYEYKNNLKTNLSCNESKTLANYLESIVISEQPKWVNPIYRMYSTWDNKYALKEDKYEFKFTSISNKANSDITQRKKGETIKLYEAKNKSKTAIL